MSTPFDRFGALLAGSWLSSIRHNVLRHVLTQIAIRTTPDLALSPEQVGPEARAIDLMLVLYDLDTRSDGQVRILCDRTPDDAESTLRWTPRRLTAFGKHVASDGFDRKLRNALASLLEESSLDVFESPLGPVTQPTTPLPGGLPTREFGDASSNRPGYTGPNDPGYQRGSVQLPTTKVMPWEPNLPSSDDAFDLDHLGDGMASTRSKPPQWPLDTDSSSSDSVTLEFSDPDIVTFEFDASPEPEAPSGAEPSTEDAPAPPATRFVNSEIDGYDRSTGLVANQAYRLNIGVDLQSSPNSIGGTTVLCSVEGRETPIEVNLVSADFQIDHPKASFTLPATGASDRAVFEIVPRKAGTGTIDVILFANGNFLQTHTLTLEVGQPAVQIPTTATTGRDIESAATLNVRHVQVMVERKDNYYEITYFRPTTIRTRLPITAEAIDKSLRRLRKTLEEIIAERDGQWKAPLQQGVQLDPATGQATLRKLAAAGQALFMDIFFPKQASDALLQISQALIKDTATPDRVIQIIQSDCPIPWALLYPTTSLDTSQARWDGFLGASHVIEQLLLQEIYPVRSTEIQGHDRVTISVNVNQAIDDQFKGEFVAPQLAYWGKVDPEHVEVTYRTSGSQLLEALGNAQTPDQVMYFYCHAVSAGVNAPNDDEPTHLLFGGQDQLTMQQLQYQAGVGVKLAQTPLVFVNACQSAQMSSVYDDSFVPYFLGKGARGVIGTECSAPAYFAADWANNFFTRFLDGKSIGTVVKELRRKYWNEHGNPLGLIYSVYCDCDTRIV